jgi:prepilin-type N-terminal cleavage/methylation domain-containing protein
LASQTITHKEHGFSLIELLVVLLVVSIVWLASIPLLQPDQHRQAQAWLTQAQNLLMLSCDLSVQTLQPHRVLWTGKAFHLQSWKARSWQAVPDVTPLLTQDIVEWQVSAQDEQKTSPSATAEMAWLCRDVGEQVAGKILLNKATQPPLILSWTGDGHYVLTTRP